MISMPDSHSKRYPSAQTGYGSHLNCNRLLSNGLSNMQSNFRRNVINRLQRSPPRSMRTFRSKMYERGGVEAAGSCVSSGSVENKKQPACTVEKENIENAIGDVPDVDSNKEEEEEECVARIETNSLDFSQAFSDLSSYSSDISGELYRLATASPGFYVYSINNNGISNNHVKEPVSKTKLVDSLVKSRHADREEHSQSKPQMSSTTTEMVYESLEPEKLTTVIKALVQDLGPGSSIELQRNAAAELRLLAKHKMENRVMIGGAGAIKPLVSLLHSPDPQTQENAVTALLNLSLCDNNKMEITRAGAIKPLIHVLKTGTSTAKQNAACTLLSLSLIDDNKITIGAAGAVPPLVALLINGSSRGKKDAATTLYTLSSLHQNKDRAIRAGAVKPLVDLMADPSSGMVDKAVIVLSNLASVSDGKSAIVQEGGIPVLVEVIETGSQKAKEFATGTLLQLCTDSYLYRTLVSREGAIPPLVALSETGNARAKQKAATLLQYLREPRQGSFREQP